jgi:hypothetical protein
MSFFRSLIAFTLTGLSLNAVAANQIFESKASRTSVLELFTSQGCSSCPPADAWLSRLRHHEGLWNELTPIAWHVDYWDYLGWRDPFSAAAHSDRHRRYQVQGGVSVVYTPGFVLDGREWRKWPYSDAPPKPAQATPGALRVEIDGDRLSVSFQPKNGDADAALTAHVVLLGMGMETKVRRGENLGKNLREDFVVLEYAMGHSQTPAKHMRWELPLPKSEHEQAHETALAVWISRTGYAAPIQATGGWLSQ